MAKLREKLALWRRAATGRRRASLRLRLAALYGGLVLLAGIVLLGLTYTFAGTRQGAAFLVSFSQAGRIEIPAPLPFLGTKSLQLVVRRQGGGAAMFVKAPTGQVLIGPAPKEPLLTGPVAVGATGTARAFPQAVAQASGFVRTAVQYQQASDRSAILVLGGAALIVVTILALGAGWLVAGRILRPLQVMTSTARRLSTETPGGRFALQGPRDEMKNLADTFDAFLDRIDCALAAERRFVANASHELRTPLAVQKTLLEVGLADPAADEKSLRELAGRLWQLNQRSRRLIDGLLLLAQSEQGVHAPEEVDLAGVVHDAAEAVGPEAGALGITIEEKLDPLRVEGDRVLLERLAGNLIENAVRHNLQGGWVQVRSWQEGGVVAIRVENTGPLVAPEDVPALFEPFRRGAGERTDSGRGAGLGLSIVRAVATSHRGEVDAKARPEGGLVVEVRLPLAGTLRD